MPSILELTNANFEQEVTNHEGWVLVDFWAPWCGPCRTMTPILEEIAKTFEGQLKVAKINVEDQQEIAGIYKIRGIPTFTILKDGQVVNTHVGSSSKAAFQMFVEQTLGVNPV